MSKPWKPNKQTVKLEQRPSRIRRDPVRTAEKPAGPASKAYWDPSEWESWVVVAGVVTFAVALFVVWIGLSAITS